MKMKQTSSWGNDGMELLRRYRGAVMGAAALWILLLHCWLMLSVAFRESIREDIWCMTNRIPSF